MFSLALRFVLVFLVLTSFGEEGAGLCASHRLFVYFALVNLCPFSLPLGVMGWLLLVVVVLADRFY